MKLIELCDTFSLTCLSVLVFKYLFLNHLFLAKKNGKTTVVEYSELYNPSIGLDNPITRESDQETGKLKLGWCFL